MAHQAFNVDCDTVRPPAVQLVRGLLFDVGMGLVASCKSGFFLCCGFEPYFWIILLNKHVYPSILISKGLGTMPLTDGVFYRQSFLC